MTELGNYDEPQRAATIQDGNHDDQVTARREVWLLRSAKKTFNVALAQELDASMLRVPRYLLGRV